ncbi:MAG: hypothetical protein ACR2PT_14125 [Endozoicomonas sp.]
MQIRQRRWLTLFFPFALLLSVSVAGYVFLPEQIASRLLSLIAREASIKIHPDQAHFSLFTGELVVQGAEITVSESLTFSSREIRLTTGLSSIWSGQLRLSEIRFQDSEINIDLDRLQAAAHQPYARLLASKPVLVFDEGYLVVRGQELWTPGQMKTAFEQIRLSASDKGVVEVNAQSASDETLWKLQGELNTETPQLAGRLLVRDVQLETTASKLLEECVNCSFQGSVSSDLLLVWSPDREFELSGDLSVGQGSGEISGGAVLNWESLAVSGFSFQSGTGKARSLKFHELNARLPGEELQGALSSIQKQVSGIQFIELQDSRLIFSWPESQGYLSGISGKVCPGKNNTLGYELQGKWLDTVSVSLTGTVEEKASRFNMSASNIDVALLPENLRILSGNDLAGARLDFSMNGRVNRKGVTRQGEAVITQLHNIKLRDDATLDFTFLTALMTDVEGKIHVPLKLNDTPLQDQSAAIVRAIEKYWLSVAEKPLAYLSRAVAGNHNLPTTLSAEPGKSQMTTDSIGALATMAQVLKARPGLQLSIQGSASQSRDWPTMAKAELESDLRELYSALNRDRVEGNKPAIIPEEVRSRLVEQMYLRTQKRKQPEIGSETPQQRVEVAERWLLENWPVKLDALKKLGQQRAWMVRDWLLQHGIEPSQIRLEPARITTDLQGVSLRLVRQGQR